MANCLAGQMTVEHWVFVAAVVQLVLGGAGFTSASHRRRGDDKDEREEFFARCEIPSARFHAVSSFVPEFLLGALPLSQVSPPFKSVRTGASPSSQSTRDSRKSP
jgi:hypothetical protein